MKTNFEGEWNSLRPQRIHSRIQLIYVPIKFDNAADATCVSWLFNAFYTKPALCRRSSKSDKIAKQIDWYNRKLDSKRFTTRLTLDQSCYYSVLPTNFFFSIFLLFPAAVWCSGSQSMKYDACEVPLKSVFLNKSWSQVTNACTEFLIQSILFLVMLLESSKKRVRNSKLGLFSGHCTTDPNNVVSGSAGGSGCGAAWKNIWLDIWS